VHIPVLALERSPILISEHCQPQHLRPPWTPGTSENYSSGCSVFSRDRVAVEMASGQADAVPRSGFTGHVSVHYPVLAPKRTPVWISARFNGGDTSRCLRWVRDDHAGSNAKKWLTGARERYNLHHSSAERTRVAGGGAEGDAPDGLATALGFPAVSPSHPSIVPHNG